MLAAHPLALGPLTLSNRILMAPVKTARGEPGGAIGDPVVRYFQTAARGGASLLITEPMAVLPSGREHPRQLAIHDEAFLPGLTRLVETIHAQGALAACHLNHAGRAANPKASGGRPVAPSPVACPATGQVPEAATEAWIGDVLIAWQAAAARAMAAGYDAIEVQMGHGYLVAQFLSPRTNQRSDRWGFDRLSFARAVLDAVTAGAPGLPLIIRVSASEGIPGGLDPDELRPLLALLEERGVVAVHAGMGSACDSPPWYYAHMSLPMAPQEQALAALRASTRLPLIAAGRMGEPERMERILDGVADAVALGRPLVADPDLPRKLLGGHPEEAILCGSCLHGCLVRVKQGKPIGCIGNPAVGEPTAVEPTTEPRRVAVVGGGPAGMMAASVLAEQGHEVDLYEREAVLGGQSRGAPVAPGKARMRLVLDSLERRLHRSNARIHLGVEFTPALLEEAGVEQVFLATGATPVLPPIPGLDSGDVRVVTGFDVFLDQPEVQGPVLVIGGGLIGMEAAELLAVQGHVVTVVELAEEVARDMDPVGRKLLMKKLGGLPVTVHRSTSVQRVSAQGVEVQGAEGSTTLPPVATVVVAVGTRPETGLARSLEGSGLKLSLVGDALAPEQIIGAIGSAWALATS